MPRLTITADSSAETLVGATGWASGSQLLTGTRPALTAKPKKDSRNTAQPMPRAERRRRPRAACEIERAAGAGDEDERDRDGDRAGLAHGQHHEAGLRAFFVLVIDK